MITYLKTDVTKESSGAADADVRKTVERVLSEIQRDGDAAVRRFSEEFDKWSPPSFRLSRSEIDGCISSLPEQTVGDIKFAQEQIRNFAKVQRDAIKDVEVETLPGVILGHRNIPVVSVGCYVPGGRYPMVASAHMSIVTARVAGVQRVIACTPPTGGLQFGHLQRFITALD